MAQASVVSTSGTWKSSFSKACRPSHLRRADAHVPRRTHAFRTRAVVVETPPNLDLDHVVELEITTSVSRPLPEYDSDSDVSIENKHSNSALAFVSSACARDAALAGGPEPATRIDSRNGEYRGLVSQHPLWRVKAPGFAGRLFFVGPKVELYPVNVFELECVSNQSNSSQSYEESLKESHSATLTLTQIKGEMVGTPPSIVTWINKAYRAEKTVTSVEIDFDKKKITTSLALKIVLEIPKPFRFVDKKKIEKGMRDAFEPQTSDAMGKVCDEVAEAYLEWMGEKG